MKIHTLTELSRQAPRIARETENGEVCMIIRHGKPIAFMVPVSDEMLEDLQLRISLKEGGPLWEALQQAEMAETGEDELKTAEEFLKERKLGD